MNGVASNTPRILQIACLLLVLAVAGCAPRGTTDGKAGPVRPNIASTAVFEIASSAPDVMPMQDLLLDLPENAAMDVAKEAALHDVCKPGTPRCDIVIRDDGRLAIRCDEGVEGSFDCRDGNLSTHGVVSLREASGGHIVVSGMPIQDDDVVKKLSGATVGAYFALNVAYLLPQSVVSYGFLDGDTLPVAIPGDVYLDYGEVSRNPTRWAVTQRFAPKGGLVLAKDVLEGQSGQDSPKSGMGYIEGKLAAMRTFPTTMAYVERGQMAVLATYLPYAKPLRHGRSGRVTRGVVLLSFVGFGMQVADSVDGQ
jgi:hypothetical protein